MSGVDDSERFDLPHVLAELAAREWEALEVIKGDLCQWLSKILQLEDISPSNFLNTLGTGVELCRLANLVQQAASDVLEKGGTLAVQVPMTTLNCNSKATLESFHARDNTSNFITWCRRLGVEEAVIFESEGLVLGKDEKRVILCLLDVARFAERVGIPPPQLVQMEREIEKLESIIAKECQRNDSTSKLERTGSEESHQNDSTSEHAPTAFHSTPKMDDDVLKRGQGNGEKGFTVSPISQQTLLPSTPLSTLGRKKFVSRIPVRSSRRLANQRRVGSTPLRKAEPTPLRRGEPTPLRSAVRPQKRRRSEEKESEEDSNTPSRKRARVGRTAKRRLPTVKGSEETVHKVKESLDVSVMRKMAECTCQKKIAVTNCGNGKFKVKGASGREMTTYARVCCCQGLCVVATLPTRKQATL